MSAPIQPLDRVYRDHRGIEVHVIGYDRAGQRVIYRRAGYEHDCVSPVHVFRSKFRRITPPGSETGGPA